MPFTAEWWPARYLMAPLKEYFNRPILCLAGIKIHKGGIQGKTMACHLMAAEWKKREMLYVAFVFKHAGVLANSSKWGCTCVRAHVCVCVCAYLLTFTVPLCTALDHWNVLRHQKTDTSKHRVFAKLWEMLSGELVTFALLRVLWKKKGREMAGVLHCQSQGYKGKGLSQELTFPCPFTCVHLSHFVATVYSIRSATVGSQYINKYNSL